VRVRLATCAAFVAFHAGLGAFLELGTFAHVCAFAFALFVPREAWVAAAAAADARLGDSGSAAAEKRAAPTAAHAAGAGRNGRALSASSGRNGRPYPQAVGRRLSQCSGGRGVASSWRRSC
jgi:hypothetical protein